ncbi:MAG: tRNA pseudouridine(38-40) synthase TruA [Elusimicrobiota bacterium]|nr:tRNA pseudouridine(38-40) synthase TruA [Elusimicrobiota bacterium]
MNFKAVVEYDGTNYFGWQIQPEVKTIQGEIERALREISGNRIRIKYASRTDRGVHARGQVVSFNIDNDISSGQLAHALNSKTPEDIIIKDLRDCSPDFNPRYDLDYKVYKYRILNRNLSDYMLRNYAWHINYALNENVIKDGLKFIEGKHNFINFSSCDRRKCHVRCDNKEKETDITVMETGFRRSPQDLITLSFKAKYFLTYMIRYLTGYLVAAASGKGSLEELKEMLSGGGKLSNYCAPARGLELNKIKYR